MAGINSHVRRMISFFNLKDVALLDSKSKTWMMESTRINERLAGEGFETSVTAVRLSVPESDHGFNNDSDDDSTLVGAGEDDRDASSSADDASSCTSASSIQVLATQQEADLHDAEPKLLAGHVRGANISKPLGHAHRKGLSVGHLMRPLHWECLASPDGDDEQVVECREDGSEAALRALEGGNPLGEDGFAAGMDLQEQQA